MAKKTDYQRYGLFALQLAVTAGVLFWILRDPVKRAEMAGAIARADRAWLLAGIGIYGLVEILAAHRWETLLRVQGIIIPRMRVTVLLLIGVFFSFFIPGGGGGDVVRVFYLLKEAPGRHGGAVLSVLFDRVVGLFALIVLTCFFVGVRWSWLNGTFVTQGYVWMTLAILGITTAGVLFTFALSGLGMVHRLPAWFPWHDKVAELALAYNLYGKAWRTSLGAVVSSMVSHIGYMVTFYCAAKAVESPSVHVPSLMDLLAIMPVVNTITALPISVGGLGLREGLFEVFLSQLSMVLKSTAVLVSSLGYLMTAVWGGIGGILYLFYRPTEHADLSAISEAAAAVEHQVAEEAVEGEVRRWTETRRLGSAKSEDGGGKPK